MVLPVILRGKWCGISVIYFSPMWQWPRYSDIFICHFLIVMSWTKVWTWTLVDLTKVQFKVQKLFEPDPKSGSAMNISWSYDGIYFQKFEIPTSMFQISGLRFQWHSHSLNWQPPSQNIQMNSNFHWHPCLICILYFYLRGKSSNLLVNNYQQNLISAMDLSSEQKCFLYLYYLLMMDFFQGWKIIHFAKPLP